MVGLDWVCALIWSNTDKLTEKTEAIKQQHYFHFHFIPDIKSISSVCSYQSLVKEQKRIIVIWLYGHKAEIWPYNHIAIWLNIAIYLDQTQKPLNNSIIYIYYLFILSNLNINFIFFIYLYLYLKYAEIHRVSSNLLGLYRCKGLFSIRCIGLFSKLSK